MKTHYCDECEEPMDAMNKEEAAKFLLEAGMDEGWAIRDDNSISHFTCKNCTHILIYLNATK